MNRLVAESYRQSLIQLVRDNGGRVLSDERTGSVHESGIGDLLMSNDLTRPPIRIRLRFNIDTGEIEFIIDDISPDRSEQYHDRIAHAIASFLDRNPEIRDAGTTIRYQLDQEWRTLTDPQQPRERGNEPLTE